MNLARHSPFFCQSAKRGAQVFHQQHQVELKARAALKAVLSVKRCSLGVDGVNQDGAAADDLRPCIGPLQGVFQQSRAKPLALLCLVNGETREQHNRNRLWRCRAGASSRFFPRDAPRSKRVVADHLEISVHDVGARVAAGLVHAGKALQPVCEGNMLAAVKLVDVVIRGQQFDRRERRFCLRFVQLAFKNRFVREQFLQRRDDL